MPIDTRGEPEARLLRRQLGPSYNVQAAVDAAHGVIMAHAVIGIAARVGQFYIGANSRRASIGR